MKRARLKSLQVRFWPLGFIFDILGLQLASNLLYFKKMKKKKDN